MKACVIIKGEEVILKFKGFDFIFHSMSELVNYVNINNIDVKISSIFAE